MDDFVVKYFTKDDADHLLKSLKNNDEILTDWEVRNYPRLSLHWNHNEDYVDISIPDYVTKALDRLQHTKPKQPQHAPHIRKRTAHGKSIQMATYTNESDLLEKITKRIKSTVGTFKYYYWSVDITMLGAINENSRVKSKLTKETDTKATMILDYAATYLNTVIWYQSRDIILHVDSEAA